jgi:hypothetical protein
MSEELTLTVAEIERLADRLDAWDGLSDRDRDVLGGVFALAGAGVATAQPEAEAEAEDEVSGFAFDAAAHSERSTYQSFELGAGKGTGGPPMFLTFTFKLVAVKTVS